MKFFLPLIPILLSVFELASSNVVIKTTDGYLKGTLMTSKKGRGIDAFLSIPFAKPPIGELRFKEPVPIEPWKGVRDATQQHALCPQRNIYTRSSVIEGEEDCLYLNVYRPENLPSDELLPVMVFFHPGGWLAVGGNTDSHGPDVLLDQDVILVVPNTRLAIFGFLSTGDHVVPGNNALKDQVMVLKWVQKNIQLFGGDPNLVTIFGGSAGGVSVHLHMLSPLSKGLFHRAASHSGTAMCLWGFGHENHGPERAKKVGALLNCTIDDNQAMVDCIRKVPARNIVALDRDFMIWDTDPMIPFRPVKEPDLPGAFMTEFPADAIKAGKVHDVPWINGLTTEDGALRVAALYGVPHLIKELDEDFNKRIAASIQFHQLAENPDEIAEKIKEFYFKDKDARLNNDTKREVLDMYTDGWFFNGIDLATHLHAKHTKSPIYYFLFGHRGVASFSAIFGDKVNDYGVCHVDDLQYLFPVGDLLFPDKQKDEADLRVTDLMTTMWANFAKYGDPTPEFVKSDLYTERWQKVKDEDNLNYYYFGGPDPESNGNRDVIWPERAQFWRSLPIRPENLKNGKQMVKDEL